MAKLSELSGEEREQYIAELKRKMQESAKRTASQRQESAEAAVATEPVVEGEADAVSPPVTSPESEAEAGARPGGPSEPSGSDVLAAAAPTRVQEAASARRDASPRPKPARAPARQAEPAAIEPSRTEMNRREFLTYAWGSALGLLALESAVAAYFFMLPRFRAGEFGGKFFVGQESALPGPDETPIGVTDGKFWLVNTEDEGPKALYMVCTHLGCLYKWIPENFRFECPCHGSKFSHDGFYIEGPAGRSLDEFEITVSETGEVVVDTGQRINGPPAGESPEIAL
jgi:cytochrome b6-f complex iron-sulfur subunit